jgi:hypothetical protein
MPICKHRERRYAIQIEKYQEGIVSPFGWPKIYTAYPWVAINPPVGDDFRRLASEEAGLKFAIHSTHHPYANPLKHNEKRFNH